MKWVQQNIHFFNGDPNRVTVHGHSAGAGDIGFHLISELGKGNLQYLCYKGKLCAIMHRLPVSFTNYKIILQIFSCQIKELIL